MKWLKSLFGSDDSKKKLTVLQRKYKSFISLLEKNNQVLRIMADMEEKMQDEYIFDINYIKSNLETLRTGVSDILENLIKLGGGRYQPLWDTFAKANSKLENILSEKQTVPEAPYTIPFCDLDKGHELSVGSKNAQIGELRKLGIQTLDGFAISAWAYKLFIESNNLQAHIKELIGTINIKRYEELVRISNDIQELIDESDLPGDLETAITREVEKLASRSTAQRFAVRSSAIGEDSSLSFAGQYSTFLNVPVGAVPGTYKKVIASKFSPKAIYYFLSHELSESNLEMSVGCTIMINAVASGVIYTRDPVDVDSETMIVNAVYGLGKYLVDGTLTPDVFYLTYQKGDIVTSTIAEKPVQLTMGDEEGVREEPVTPEKRQKSAIDEKQLKILFDLAQKIETHYGKPQDIEWAIDGEGRCFILQTRPLRIVKRNTDSASLVPEGLKQYASGGTTVCPGRGVGKIYRVTSSDDLSSVPEGVILTAKNSFPGLITVMNRVNAIIVEVGGVASHMATIAREYKIPTLTGITNIESLNKGEVVSVDADNGIIYHGADPAFETSRQADEPLFDDIDPFKLLKSLLELIVPLNMVHPTDKDFVIDNCRTFHDITRFAHQKAMEEMFYKASTLSHKGSIGLILKSSIPLRINIIYLDQEWVVEKENKWIEEDEVASLPMKAFLEGLKQHRWVQENRDVTVKGFLALVASSAAASRQIEYSENSYAILSKEYVIMGLNLGYHFTSIEAMCTDTINKNFIRMQYKEGGASFERRVRRIQLITEICSKMGFENHSKSDYLDTRFSGCDASTVIDKLRLLGRLVILTKQLDMSLANDAITKWYTNDIMKKMNLIS